MNYVPDMPEKIEEHPITFCDVCNRDLYEGDGVYRIDGDTICSDECLGSYFDWAKTGVYKKGDK